MTTEILEDARRRMQGAVDALNRDLAGYRTNRASPALVENIMAVSYIHLRAHETLRYFVCRLLLEKKKKILKKIF